MIKIKFREGPYSGQYGFLEQMPEFIEVSRHYDRETEDPPVFPEGRYIPDIKVPIIDYQIWQWCPTILS